jgi:hypothetical protein
VCCIPASARRYDATAYPLQHLSERYRPTKRPGSAPSTRWRPDPSSYQIRYAVCVWLCSCEVHCVGVCLGMCPLPCTMRGSGPYMLTGKDAMYFTRKAIFFSICAPNFVFAYTLNLAVRLQGGSCRDAETTSTSQSRTSAWRQQSVTCSVFCFLICISS